MKKLQITGITLTLLLASAVTFSQVRVYNGPGGAIAPNASAANGNVGIGTNNPTGAALHILTGSNRGMLPAAIKLDRNDGTNQAGLLTIGISSNGFTTGLGGGSAFFKLEDPYGNSANSDMGFSTNGLAAQLVIKHNGNVGIGTSTPTEKLHVAGNICYTGAIAACSDARYKTNITALENPTEKILLLNGVSYDWNTAKFPGMNFSDKKQIGFIAQEVEQLFPELVFTDATGYKSIDYTRLTPILVETVKNQQKEIIAIQKRLAAIEKKLHR